MHRLSVSPDSGRPPDSQAHDSIDHLALEGRLPRWLTLDWLDPREAPAFFTCLLTLLVVGLVAASLLLVVASAKANVNDVPIGGFQPWVAFTLTDEFSTENQDELFFVAEVDSTYNANRALPDQGMPEFAVGLLDSGSQVNLLQWQTMLDFDLPGTGFTGTEFIPAVGVGGTELLRVEDPLGIYASGLQNATSGTPGTALDVPNLTTLRGLKSNAPATAPIDSQLPNVVGLPMMSTHTTVIRNSQPQFVESNGTTFRAPSVEFLPLGAAIPGDFTRRAALSLDVNPLFGTTEPLYVFNVNNVLSGLPLHEDPATPTAVGGAFFTDLDLTNNGTTRTAEVFFDTGAQVTVVNELLAAQLGFDVVNDEPEFTVPILGVGGTLTEIPGFTVDQLVLPAVGGNFVANDVPVVVLTEVPNPLGAGILDGILGTNVFWDRDLVVDPNGSRLWISDPVTNVANFTGGLNQDDFSTAAHWDRPQGVDALTQAIVNNGSRAIVFQDESVYRLVVGGEPTVPSSEVRVQENVVLSIYTEATVFTGAKLTVLGDVKAQSIELEGGELFGWGGTLEADINNAGTLRLVSDAQFEQTGTYQQESDGLLDVVWQATPTPGTGNENFVVDGLAGLDGTLELYAPFLSTETIGSQFGLIAADSVLGVFDAVLGIVLQNDRSLAVLYTADSVVVEVALSGDANLNQQVEQGDLDAVLQNWGQSNFDADDSVAVTWVTGDLTGDGMVDQGDLDAVLQNWGSAAAPDLRGLVVPEPAALITFGFAAMLVRRRRAGLVA